MRTPGPWKWDDEMLWNEPADVVVLNHAGCGWNVNKDDKKAISKVPGMIDFLHEVEDFLDDRADTEDASEEDGYVRPNQAMQLLTQLRKLLAKVGE